MVVNSEQNLKILTPKTDFIRDQRKPVLNNLSLYILEVDRTHEGIIRS